MYFGWYVVAGTFASQMLVVGFFFYSVSLLVGPVREEFGVSLEQVMYSMTLGTLFGLLVTPVCGALIDRYPVRWLISCGLLLFALGLWWTGSSGSITEYVLAFGLTLSVANGLAGTMICSTVVARWFTHNRGKALGVTATGTSLGGVLIPALLGYWVISDGWRVAMDNLALAAVLVVLPIVILSVRGRPEDIGLQIDSQGGDDGAPPTPKGGLTARQILTKPAYWYLSLALGIMFCAFTATLANLSFYATNLGYRPEQGATLIMLVALFNFVGKLVFGYLADRLDLKHGLWTSIGLVAAALLMLALQPPYLFIVLAAMLLGLASGGVLPVWGAIMARVFGLISYGKAMGLMGPVLTLTTMPGFVVIGRLYDLSGSYQLGIGVFAGLALLAALILLPLRLDESA